MNKLGFVIANDAEEYLLKYDITPHGTLSAWSSVPKAVGFALRFETRREVKKVIKSLPSSGPLWRLELFETDLHFFVATNSPHKPNWLI
jgi:hypothetical protein